MHNIILHNPDSNQVIALEYSHFLQSIQLRLSPKSVSTYKAHLSDFKQWFIQEPLTTTLKLHLLKYRAHLIERYGSAKSINLSLSTIRTFYKWMLENDRIDYDPSIVLKNIKASDSLKRSPLSRDQLETIFSYLETAPGRNAKRNRAIFVLAVMNGLRVSEIAHIKTEDFGTVQGRPVVYLLRKGHIDKSAYVILQDKTLAMLEEFIGDDEGYIFKSLSTGGKMDSNSISRIIKATFKAVGIDSEMITAHSLRHTYSMLAIEGGASLVGLSRSMNHKSISTTMEYLKSYDRISNAAEDSISLDF